MNIRQSIALGLMLVAGGTANAAIITDGNVKLGVDRLAQLNVPGSIPSVGGTTAVGVRFLAGGSEYEATSHGCLCEGWGVSSNDGSGATSGYANNSTGIAGLTQQSFTSTASTATVVVTTNDGNLRVTHAFALSSSSNLYELTVTIEALVDVTDVRYRRTMDWDADPTMFNEYVRIGGTTGATNVLGASNDGFSSSNPLASLCGNFGLANCLQGDFGDSLFAYSGNDHGANFDFGFGDLAAGGTKTFSIFYGGADSVAAAFAAMGAVGIEVYSLSRSYLDADGNGFADSSGAKTPTYIFGFKGVGGTPVATPEPGSLALLGLGLLGLAGLRRRGK